MKIYKYYRKIQSVNGNTKLARLWDGYFCFYCRSILFDVLYVTFSLLVINVIRMLVSSRSNCLQSGSHGQYNNLFM